MDEIRLSIASDNTRIIGGVTARAAPKVQPEVYITHDDPASAFLQTPAGTPPPPPKPHWDISGELLDALQALIDAAVAVAKADAAAKFRMAQTLADALFNEAGGLLADRVKVIESAGDEGDFTAFVQGLLTGASIDDLARKHASNFAGIADAQVAIIRNGEAIASIAQVLGAQIGQNAASILDERTVRADQYSASALLITNLQTSTSQNATDMTSEQFTRSSVDNALAFRMDRDGAVYGGSADKANLDAFFAAIDAGNVSDAAARANAKSIAGIQTLQVSYADATEAIAAVQTILGAAIGQNAASVESERIARSDQHTALAASIDTLTATIGGSFSSVSTVAAAFAGITGPGGAIDGLDGQIFNITGPGGLLDGINGDISTTNGNVTTANGHIADINTILGASYGVRLDVNGYVAGFGIINGGSDIGSAINFRADRLTLVMPGYSAQPVLIIGTVNGVPTLAFNGNIVNDLSLLNSGIGNNAVSHSAGASSTSYFVDVSITLRAGARAAIFGSFTVADGSATATSSGNGYLYLEEIAPDVSILTVSKILGVLVAGGGSSYAPDGGGGSSGYYQFLPTTASAIFTAPSTGTYTFRCIAVNSSQTIGWNGVSIQVNELSK